MPKKKTSHKKVHHKKVVSRHFLWSIFFVSTTAAINIYLVGVERTLGESYTWPLIAVLLSAVTLVALGYERKIGKLGTGKFLWSILMAALLLAATIAIANGSNYDTLPTISLGSSIVALILLVYEKYSNK